MSYPGATRTSTTHTAPLRAAWIPFSIARASSDAFATGPMPSAPCARAIIAMSMSGPLMRWRSEEHTSELQSQSNLVCRLLLEKKNITQHMVVTDVIIGYIHHCLPLDHRVIILIVALPAT